MTDTGAYRAAIRLLAVSDKTPAALFRRLSEKGYPERECADAVARLIREGYLNELSYAEKTVKKLYEKSYGPLYIEAYMKSREFSDEAAEYAAGIMSELDFDRSAKSFVSDMTASGKTKQQALSALYKRGFEL